MSHTQTTRQTPENTVRLYSNEVHILVTSVVGSLVAAAHTTCQGAMAAAVNWVEGVAETRLNGSLKERFERACRHMAGQGERIKIVSNPILSRVS